MAALLVTFGVLTACGGRGAGGGVPESFEGSPGVVRAAIAADAPVADLVAGFSDAGFDLLRTQPIQDNVVFSPASIGHALLMARAAADEPTGAAIDTAFALPGGRSAHEAWNAIDLQVRAGADASPDVRANIADRIWPALGVQPDQAWIDLLASEHGTDVRSVDLAGDPEGSRSTINDWVGQQTEDLIPQLLPEGFINGQTVLVLTDALYFEAPWAVPFQEYRREGEFTRLDGSTAVTPLMRQVRVADRHGEGDGFAAAEIPYAGDEFSMLVLVPEEGRFADVRARLNGDLLRSIDATFSTGPYELLLPPWEDDTQLDLTTWLTDIGAAPGSYPRISPDSELVELDAAVHAADIGVDEWGTVAAAATGLGFAETSLPQPEQTVAADKPFFYLIRHRDTGLVLFTGQVTDPAA